MTAFRCEAVRPFRRLTGRGRPTAAGRLREMLAAKPTLTAASFDRAVSTSLSGGTTAARTVHSRCGSGFAGFGYGIALIPRYQARARDGCSWLLVYAPDGPHARRVAEMAQQNGALLAVKDNRLVIEDLVRHANAAAMQHPTLDFSSLNVRS
jgi:hypothetical protein